MAVSSALPDGVDLVIGQPDDPVDGVDLDIDAEEGRVSRLVFPHTASFRVWYSKEALKMPSSPGF